jgi:hypothetical protein
MQKFILKQLLTGAMALFLALGTMARGQGITTSEMTGSVMDAQGKPIAAAVITVLHEPTGTKTVTTSRANGQFNLSGLRVGGPYSVTASVNGYRGETKNGVYLDVGSGQNLTFSLPAEVVMMEAFKVEMDSDVTFGSGKMATGSTYDVNQIDNTATVRRNIQDIAQLDSRLTLMALDQTGQLSAQGQHPRYNSFLIDGVQAGDPFGLNSNGFASLRSPVPLESIQSLSIELNPYDVRRSGFTGALINAVTKSGSNQFHGSATVEYTGQNWRAKNPVTGVHEPFQEHTYDYTFSGPLIKNRLFFFFNYDEFKRSSVPPAANIKFTDQTVIDQIVARAKALGYDPGVLSATNVSKQRTVIGKIDWNINDSHRLSFTYRKNHGEETNFASYTSATLTSMSNYWFQSPRNTETKTGQLVSNWTPNFRTEVNYSQTDYDGSPTNHGTPFPEVTVNNLNAVRADTGASITNASLRFGTEFSRQLNFLTTKQKIANVQAEYSIGEHTLSVGTERDETKYIDKFAQAIFGSYNFASAAAWLAGTPVQSYTDASPFAGHTISDAFGIWKYTNYGTFLQDKWKPNDRLTLIAGARMDYPSVPDKPLYNAAFETAFGVRNDTTNDGNYIISPRFGFNYELKTDRKTQIRGGFGLFQGKSPGVWLTNAFQTNGTLGTINQNNPPIVFEPDVTKQPIPAGTLPAPNINITDPKFKQPSVWKGNLALDHTLPFGGLVFSAEVTYTKVYKAVNFQFLNYQVATSGPTTTPDGRIRYAGTITSNLTGSPFTSTTGRRRVTTFADVYSITNTDKGAGHDFTLSLSRPMKNNWGASFSWTHSHTTEVSPATSFTASSSYSSRATFNPNEDVESLSNTNIPDRLVGTYTREFHFVKNAPTTASLIYQARTGHAYSWVFSGDANGDGFTFNDLLYVPTGPSDPNVTWTNASERDAFFAFVNSTDLKNYMGSHAPRNSEIMPWTQTFDLKLTQEIPMPYVSRLKAQAYLNILNIGNLLNSKWGILEEVPFSYKRAVAGATYDPTGNAGKGQWIYAFNGGTLNGVPVVANDQPVSRWQIEAGLRLQF